MMMKPFNNVSNPDKSGNILDELLLPDEHTERQADRQTDRQ